MVGWSDVLGLNVSFLKILALKRIVGPANCGSVSGKSSNRRLSLRIIAVRGESAMSKINIEYLQLVTRHQAAICGYIRSIAPGLNADDVLQETNIVLWNKADTFERGTNFKAFAFRIAHLKTLEALRRQKRDQWLHFDSDLLEAIATHRQEEESELSGRQHALRQCLEDLDDKDRGLLHERYTERRTVRSIALSHERTEGAMQQVFFRIRNALRACIDT